MTKPKTIKDQIFEVIQQWQYEGGINPVLLNDFAFENAKKSGITSLQSYVNWNAIEQEQGKPDFSCYDDLVKKIRNHQLRWVPFLILGPNYSVPQWFHDSEKSVYAQCLEHSLPSKIQSIWNPHLPNYVEHFIKIFAERYKDSGIIESILLGISGNWGEALYPVSGGFSSFHSHHGWWCGDRYALECYRKHLEKKFNSIENLNVEYRSSYLSFSEVMFPVKRNVFESHAVRWIPQMYKLFRISKKIRGSLKRQVNRFFAGVLKIPPNPPVKKWSQWLDFVAWYQDEMIRWSDFWLQTAKKYLPNTKIYLVTGGDGSPQSGGHFTKQVKIAKKNNSGIRITNQMDDFPRSFVFSRPVSSASRFYESFYSTEEAWINDAEGILARIFDAATSGPCGMYCKNIIGYGYDRFMKRTYPAGIPCKGLKDIKEILTHIKGKKPVVDIAVFFPNTSLALGSSVWKIYALSAKLREHADYDMIDEQMLEDGALSQYNYLVAAECHWIRSNHLSIIADWISDGGLLILQKSSMNNIDQPAQYDVLFKNNNETTKIDKGYIFKSNTTGIKKHINFIIKTLSNKQNLHTLDSPVFVDDKINGIYTSVMNDEVIFYNSNIHSVVQNISIKDKTLSINLKPKSIESVDISQ